MSGKIWKYTSNGQDEDNSELEDFGGVKWWYWKSVSFTFITFVLCLCLFCSVCIPLTTTPSFFFYSLFMSLSFYFSMLFCFFSFSCCFFVSVMCASLCLSVCLSVFFFFFFSGCSLIYSFHSVLSPAPRPPPPPPPPHTHPFTQTHSHSFSLSLSQLFVCLLVSHIQSYFSTSVLLCESVHRSVCWSIRFMSIIFCRVK